SLYSRTAIDYRVPAGMKKFKATAGIDDSVRDIGNIRLKISADGKTLFDKPVTGKDVPVELDLEVAGAKRLSILVDYGDQFDAGDYLDLADARMLK
ncbi:MAG TPA: NPCBM/NEW2 domain-containing protein, partial [Pirellulales bacterium]